MELHSVKSLFLKKCGIIYVTNFKKGRGPNAKTT